MSRNRTSAEMCITRGRRQPAGAADRPCLLPQPTMTICSGRALGRALTRPATCLKSSRDTPGATWATGLRGASRGFCPEYTCSVTSRWPLASVSCSQQGHQDRPYTLKVAQAGHHASMTADASNMGFQ
jgi:hypothetical protein